MINTVNVLIDIQCRIKNKRLELEKLQAEIEALMQVDWALTAAIDKDKEATECKTNP